MGIFVRVMYLGAHRYRVPRVGDGGNLHRCISEYCGGPFKVRGCTSYLGRDRPSWEEMKDLAIEVLPASSAKKVGFRSNEGVTRDDERELVAVKE